MRILLGLRRILFFAGGLLLFLEVLYVASAAVFLNSRLFIRATGMEDTTRTHIRVTGAWSPYPGRLRAREIRVGIRDQNVVIDVRLNSPELRFDPRALFRKTVEIRDLKTPQVTVDVHIRTTKERMRYIAEHPDPRGDRPYTDEEIEELRARHWTIHVPHLTLARVDPIDFDGKEVHGEIRIEGGFLLQPGVEAEIFPTRVRFTNASFRNGLEDIQGEAIARFRRFSAPRTQGSEVFRYLDAEARLQGKVDNFDFLNLTLRSLNGFGFADGRVKFRSELFVRSGRLRRGSFFETPDDRFELQSPSFHLVGKGQIRWSIPEDDGFSRLVLSARDVKVRHAWNSLLVRGKAQTLHSEARIEGVALKEPFRSLEAGLRIGGGTYAVDAQTGFPWNARGRIEGVLSGLTDRQSNEASESIFPMNRLSISIDQGRVGFSVPLSVRGKIGFSGPALSLSRVTTLPNVAFDLRVAKERNPENASRLPVTLRGSLSGPESSASPIEGKVWKGRGRIRITEFNQILDELANAGILSKTLRALAAAHRVETKFHWKKRDDYTLLHAESIQSDGSWAANGVYTYDTNGRWMSLIQGSVIGLPILVALAPGESEWKIVSSRKEDLFSDEDREEPRLKTNDQRRPQ